jgi:hypothetical protein
LLRHDRQQVAMARLLLLLVLAFPAVAQELTPEARASPYASQWMTLRGPQHTHGELYQGDTRLPGAGALAGFIDRGGEWVEAFSAVPAAYELAQEARVLQRVHLATFWAGYGGLAAAGLGWLVAVDVSGRAVPPSPAFFVALGSAAAVFVALEAVALVTGWQWPRRVSRAVRVYNRALNDSLPEEQRFELGG